MVGSDAAAGAGGLERRPKSDIVKVVTLELVPP